MEEIKIGQTARIRKDWKNIELSITIQKGEMTEFVEKYSHNECFIISCISSDKRAFKSNEGFFYWYDIKLIDTISENDNILNNDINIKLHINKKIKINTNL